MSEIKKTDVIQEGVDTEFNAITKSIQGTVKALDSIIATSKELDTSLTKGLKSQQAVNEANVKAKTNADKLNKANVELNSVRIKAVKTSNSYFKSIEGLNKQRDKEAAKIEKTNKKLQTEANRRKLAADKILKQKSSVTNLISELQKEVKTEDQALASNKKLLAVRKSLNSELPKQAKQIALINKQLNKNNALLTTNASKYGKVKRGIGEYERGIGKAGKSTLSFGKSLLGAAGITGGLTSVISLFKSIGKTITDFSSAQSKLASVLGKTKDEITSLTEDSLAYGKATQFTATEVAGLQTELAKLGFTTSEIRGTTSAILDLSTATGAGLADAAKVTGVALRAFGLDAEESGRVTSALAVATTKSALAFSDYETILSTVAPVAKKFGFTLEDTLALTGKLKDAGFDASSAATATRNILLNLADGNGKLAKTLGAPIKDLDGLAGAFKELNNKGVDLGTTLELTDKRSVAAFNTFLEGTDKVLDLRDGVTGVKEELDKMVDVQLDNLTGDVDKLTSAWDGLILSVESGDGVISKAIRGLVQYVTEAINATDVQAGIKKLGEDQAASVDVLITKNGKLKQSNDEYNKSLETYIKIYTKKALLEGQNKEYITSYIEGLNTLRKKSDAQIASEKEAAEKAVETALIASDGLVEVNQKKNDKILADNKKAAEKEQKFYDDLRQESFDREIAATAQNNIELINETKQRYIDGEISAEQASKEIEKIQLDSAIKQVEALQIIVDAENLNTDERIEANEKLATAKEKLIGIRYQDALDLAAFEQEQLDESVKSTEDAEQKKADAVKKAEDEKKAARQEAFSQSLTLINSLFDYNQTKIDAELSELEKSYDYQSQLAGDNEEAKSRIDAKYQIERTQLLRKQAQQEKNQAIFNATINAALAISKAIASAPPPANFVLAAFSGAAAAVQIAAIQRSPLPKFKDGVTDFKGGVAMVNDGNGQELIKTPNGLFMAEGKNVILDLPRHTDVINAEETKKMLSPKLTIDDKKDMSIMLIQSQLIKVEKAIKNQEGVRIDIDQHGIRTFRNINNRTNLRLDEMMQ